MVKMMDKTRTHNYKNNNKMKKTSMDKIRIGLIGLGNVGRGVLTYMLNPLDSSKFGYQVEYVGISNGNKRRDFTTDLNQFNGKNLPMPKLTTNVLEDIINNPEIDVVVDAVGGNAEYDKTSLTYIVGAIENGKHVVTANKNNIARNLSRLTALANKNKVNLRYEGAVCGGIPIIRALNNYFFNDEILKIVGIINGTSNYILTKMHEGKTYEEALGEAQKEGYAEADPTNDVNGTDAASKLAILASLAFKTEIKPENITLIEGIDRIKSYDVFYVKEHLSKFRDQAHIIKSLGIIEKKDNKLELKVIPAFISEQHPLYGTNGAINAITIVGKFSGIYTFKGPGAGSAPTGFALVNDILDIGERIKQGVVANFSSFENTYELLNKMESSGFVRSVSPEHRNGVFGEKTKIFAKHGLDIYQIYNFPGHMTEGDDALLPDIISIERAKEENINAMLKELKSARCNHGEPIYLREDLVF
ncbi:MAG: homoserine dehydrogenase [Nanoarchaeota archaeon]|nr:homoserine dehydrogenase [Nanoarchaeota archaeon]